MRKSVLKKLRLFYFRYDTERLNIQMDTGQTICENWTLCGP